MEREDILTLWDNWRNGKDTTAFNRLFDALAPRILNLIKDRFSTSSITDIEDSVSESFFVLIMHPEKFDPTRATLVTFLFTIARNKLIDKTRAEQRYNIISLDILQQEPFSESLFASDEDEVESKAIAHILFAGRDERNEFRPDVQTWLQKTLPDPRDRALFLLSIEGRLTVGAFVELYEAHTLSLEEQRSEMKRHRDRIKKRVTRASATLRQLLIGFTDVQEKTLDGK
ncbi:MAG: RNA polymerase sigma factor [Armatimonas sp.]